MIIIIIITIIIIIIINDTYKWLNINGWFRNVSWKWFATWIITHSKTKTKLRNTFNNNMSADLKLSKTQISKIIQSGGFLSKLLGSLLKTGLPLIKNVIRPLAKSVLIPLGSTAAASEADEGIHKKY